MILKTSLLIVILLLINLVLLVNTRNILKKIEEIEEKWKMLKGVIQ